MFLVNRYGFTRHRNPPSRRRLGDAHGQNARRLALSSRTCGAPRLNKAENSILGRFIALSLHTSQTMKRLPAWKQLTLGKTLPRRDRTAWGKPILTKPLNLRDRYSLLRVENERIGNTLNNLVKSKKL